MKIPTRRLAPLAAVLFVSFLAAPPVVSAQGRSISSPSTEKGKPIVRGKKQEKPADAAGHVSAEERRAIDAIDRAVPEFMALLEATVNVNSGTMNFEGVRQVARLYEPPLAALGFTTRWNDGAAWSRAGHLVARRVPGERAGGTDGGSRRPGVRAVGASNASPSSDGRPKLLLIGHLDTVFEKDGPFQRWERLSDSTVRGPGTSDMKGGTAVMLLALRGLEDAGLLDRFAITVFLSGDEEKMGKPASLSRRDLREAAEWADVAIGFEDGPGDPRYAVVARRGAGDWKLDVTAKPYHSGQIFRPDVGAGAVFETARILTAFRDSLGGQRHLTFNPGTIVGGTDVTYDSLANRGTAFGKTNVIAEHASVHGDLRALTREQTEAARETMRRIVAAGSPHTSARIRFEESYPPLAPSEGNQRLLAIYDRASRDLGFGAVEGVDPSRAGAADISFCDGLVEMAMDGVGMPGDGGHTTSETADVAKLHSQAKRMAVTLLRLAKERR